MKSTFSISADKYKAFLPIISALEKAGSQQNIPFILIGAFARDLLLNEVYKYDLNFRATLDIDFAVIVNDWDEYKELLESILTFPGFQKTKIPHRLNYSSIDIDIIPFGAIAKYNQIKWPENDSLVLNVLGFKEVYAKSISCQINKIEFNIVSLEGFIVIKLLAWNDRKLITHKDAEDLGIFLFNYNNLNPEELFSDFSYLIESSNYDYTMTGVKILAIKLRDFINQSTELKKTVISILKNELSDPDNSQLATYLSKIVEYEYSYQIIETLYKALV